MSTPNIHVLFFAIFASLLSSTCCDIDRPQHDVALFVFGDSLNDAGTNNYINTTASFRANFPPYGETFFHYPTGRFTDGRLIADFIAEYANLPLIPPYLQMKDGEFMGGANFASAGAGALVDTYKGFVVDLKMQLKQLQQLEKKLRKDMGSERAKRIIKEGVYLISIGSNDCFLFFNPALFQSISMEDYVGMVIGNITTVLKGIYEVGGRKFAMIGIGQLGCVPSKRALTRNGACAGEANKIAKLHNVALTSILAKLETQLQGFEYSYFDFYTSGSERIQYPSKYAEYANLPLIPPYLQMKDGEFMGGANFASGGAGALVDTYKGYVVDLKMQLKQLEQLEMKLRKEMGSEKAKRIIKEGVYLISIGTNDYSLFLNPALFRSISMEEYVGMVIGNITTVLKGIYEVGGRKFAMIGIGKFGCAPSRRALTRNGACSGEANKIAKLHNVALTSILAKLETQLHGFQYSYFDYYTSGSERIQYPSKYGFKEAKTACCGSGPYRGNFTCGGQRGVKEYSLCRHPEEHVFFDSGHSSERANRQYARLMWKGSLSVIRPRNLKALFKHEGA
ncbi:GDSL esterase/lipase 2-like isoform X2 [Syzygium oleosum]|uniref:GDSL esterase/lipase 2-like isoform X2 n=1 Tax=Syzygium oleosum TaxID=219896 RepID=UPI0024B87AD3|nr:GDSL esterase/lipase 2-like isoform X2 [Syzygium oleosum]